MGSSFFISHSNAIVAHDNWTKYFTTPFEVIVYKCEDSNCVTCSYDLANRLTGSKMCTLCATGHTWNVGLQICEFTCPNGVMNSGEVCDAGINLGCEANCLGVKANFTCSGLGFLTSSVCTC
jgi:hypothetical protein